MVSSSRLAARAMSGDGVATLCAGWTVAYSDWDHGVLSRHRCHLHLARLQDVDFCRGVDQSGLPQPPRHTCITNPIVSAVPCLSRLSQYG